MEINKKQYLKENGWWAHYHSNCWFDGKLDKLDVDEKGFVVGFRPENEGITLEEAFKIVYEKKRI
tara:strand:+ start:829 stop:1023 length:195 start_codon:yes stop_codon:yes gene_type:complete